MNKLERTIESLDSKSFLVFVTGTIQSATFPLGPENSHVFCRYEIVTGTNWKLISGITTGISQASMPRDPSDKIVFNIPFECLYRSYNPFGWPQLIVSVYGKNRWSVETTLGYCWIHLPLVGSNVEESIRPIRVSKDTTVMGELSSWIQSKNAELKNPKILLDSFADKEYLSMEKIGEMKFCLQTLCRGTEDIIHSSNKCDNTVIKKKKSLRNIKLDG